MINQGVMIKFHILLQDASTICGHYLSCDKSHEKRFSVIPLALKLFDSHPANGIPKTLIANSFSNMCINASPISYLKSKQL